MKTAFIIFWSAMIFLSILWYALLLFYVGYKGAREIIQMTRNLRRKQQQHSSEA